MAKKTKKTKKKTQKLPRCSLIKQYIEGQAIHLASIKLTVIQIHKTIWISLKKKKRNQSSQKKAQKEKPVSKQTNQKINKTNFQQVMYTDNLMRELHFRNKGKEMRNKIV